MTKVLILGGAGFLGRAILANDPFTAEYTVASRDETKQEAVRRRFPDVHTVLADVRDERALETLMHGMDFVVHAAAVKYVDWAEDNVVETIDVNVRGTENVLRAAGRAGVSGVVVVSTDKATAPLNTYGATKQLAERLVGEFSRRWPNTNFTACRYGNVVGSTGSVVFKWIQAIQDGEPVALTEPAMTRFWMAPSDAVDVVKQAMYAPSGMTYIPRCGAMRLGDLVEALGAKGITRIPVRPGERMDEMLVTREEWPRIHMTNDKAMWLAPAYMRGRAGEASEYRSNSPDHWIEPDELRAMVEEARTLWV
mgnify:CR=1 FL=1